MIFKRWIEAENRWELWDSIERISYQKVVNEEQNTKKLSIYLVFRDEKKEPFEIEEDLKSKEILVNQMYILNDEGKTVERIN